MTGNPSGLLFGTSIVPATLDILGLAEDDCEGGGILRVGFPGIQGVDAGGTGVSHHLQCGGGCGGETLGQCDGGERGQAERAGTREMAPK